MFDKYSSYHVLVTHIGICYSVSPVFSGYHVININRDGWVCLILLQELFLTAGGKSAFFLRI